MLLLLFALFHHVVLDLHVIIKDYVHSGETFTRNIANTTGLLYVRR